MNGQPARWIGTSTVSMAVIAGHMSFDVKRRMIVAVPRPLQNFSGMPQKLPIPAAVRNGFRPMSVPAAARLEALRALAQVAEGALPLGLNAVTMTADGVPSIRPPQPTRLSFVADGLPFHAAASPQGDGAVCQIWAEVGHIPYTAQAPERRRRLLAILRAMPRLERARFVVQEQKILLASESRRAGAVTAEDLIHETVALIQEARPFLRMLGEWL